MTLPSRLSILGISFRRVEPGQDEGDIDVPSSCAFINGADDWSKKLENTMAEPLERAMVVTSVWVQVRMTPFDLTARLRATLAPICGSGLVPWFGVDSFGERS